MSTWSVCYSCAVDYNMAEDHVCGAEDLLRARVQTLKDALEHLLFNHFDVVGEDAGDPDVIAAVEALR